MNFENPNGFVSSEWCSRKVDITLHRLYHRLLNLDLDFFIFRMRLSFVNVVISWSFQKNTSFSYHFGAGASQDSYEEKVDFSASVSLVVLDFNDGRSGGEELLLEKSQNGKRSRHRAMEVFDEEKSTFQKSKKKQKKETCFS